MQQISKFMENISLRMPEIDIIDIAEILIISFLVYYIMIWIKNSRAWALLKGLTVIFVFLLIASYFHMNTIIWISNNVLGFAVTALIVVLQPELRKALEELGNKNLISSVLPFETAKPDEGRFSDKTMNEIIRACVEMSKVKTGALIVVEQQQFLKDYEKTGIEVDAIVSSQLLINIFEHNTPLHDGAVIIRGNRVISATCYLPLSDNRGLDKELGTRHRAGVGLSEVTDSLTVIVSEETGKISVAYEGKIERGIDAERLREYLAKIQNKGTEVSKKTIRWKKGRSKSDKNEKEIAE